MLPINKKLEKILLVWLVLILELELKISALTYKNLERWESEEIKHEISFPALDKD